MNRISPKLAKGSLFALPSVKNKQPFRLAVFQFNPESIARTMFPQVTEKPPLQFKDMPEEEITLTARFDATDYMAGEDDAKAKKASARGVGPQLATLELMLSPSVIAIGIAAVKARGGLIEIGETDIPLTLFVWGKKPPLPVQIIELAIVEEAFSPDLVPIRAEVDITLKVLSYGHFKTANPLENPGFGLYMAHHAYKEALSLMETPGQVDEALNSYM
jgi:hypothetical protein